MASRRKFIFRIINQAGQSTVEYIMLMALMATLVFGVLKSDPFQEIFGDNSRYFSGLASIIQFSYRHGYLGDSDERDGDNYNYSGGTVNHQSYRLDDTTRFFVPTEPYPQ